MSKEKYYISYSDRSWRSDLLFRVVDAQYFLLALRPPDLGRWIQMRLQNDFNGTARNATNPQEITEEEVAMILFGCRR